MVSPERPVPVSQTEPTNTNPDIMLEKPLKEEQVETASDDAQLEEGYSTSFQYDRATDKKVVWKLDLLLQPILFVTFVLLLLDRANVGK